ncbi:hypothetical protein BH09BAC5_BH09BAC5_18380 [soil metagenome]
MKKNIAILATVLIVIFSFGFSLEHEKKAVIYYQPEKGMVPDSVTAIKVAEAILVTIYGKEQIESEKPLRAHLTKDGDTWAVSGILSPSGKSIDKNGDTVFTIVEGGVASIGIQKSDCKVLYLEHGK